MNNSNQDKHSNNYITFILMLTVSFIAMYITMYLNTYAIDQLNVWKNNKT